MALGVFTMQGLTELSLLESQLRRSLSTHWGVDVGRFPFAGAIELELPETPDLPKVVASYDATAGVILQDSAVIHGLDLLRHAQRDGTPFFFAYPQHLASGGDELSRIVSQLNDALALILRRSDFFVELIRRFLRVIVPLRPVGKDLGHGCTVELWRGVVFVGPCTKDPDPIVLAMGLVHELAHGIMSLLNASDPLILVDADGLVYSPIRQARRPRILAFHALLALTFMVRLARECGYATYARSLHEDALMTSHQLESTRFSAVGRMLFEEISSKLAQP